MGRMMQAVSYSVCLVICGAFIAGHVGAVAGVILAAVCVAHDVSQ